MPVQLSDLYPLSELAQRHPDKFTKSAPHYLLRMRRQPNGIAPYLRWIGRIPYTSDSLIAEWLEQRGEPQAVA